MFNKPLEDWPKQPLNTITIWLSVIQPAFKEAWIKSYLNEPLSKDNKEELSPLHTHHLDYRLYLFFTFWYLVAPNLWSILLMMLHAFPFHSKGRSG
jgi:hypothetical protein